MNDRFFLCLNQTNLAVYLLNNKVYRKHDLITY